MPRFLSALCIQSIRFKKILNYLRQVNEVNGGDNVFVRCLFVVVWCVCAVDRGELNANSSKTVEATDFDFKFDTRMSGLSQGQSGHDPKNFPKRGVAMVMWPLNRWALNANSSKTVKATDFKFGIRVPSDSSDVTPKIFPKGGVAMVTWPLNFWALNVNSSKTVKATDFKFDTRVPSDSSDVTPKILTIYLAEICTLTSAF